MQQALSEAVLPGTPEDWSLVVLVDKTRELPDLAYTAIADGRGEQRVNTWTVVADGASNPLDERQCRWCRTNEMAQKVRIDPRTFEALALPGEDLVMPDVSAASDAVGLWDLANTADALGVREDPLSGRSLVARPKDEFMEVRVHLDRLIAHAGFGATLDARFADIRLKSDERAKLLDSFASCDAVVVSRGELDVKPEAFEAAYGILMEAVGLEDVPRIPLEPDGAPARALIAYGNVLVVTMGEVTGWQMRQLLQSVQDGWRGGPGRGRQVGGLVLHARPTTSREWINLYSSFERRLMAVWLTYLPWRSPLAEELALLRQVANRDGLSSAALDFLDTRTAVCEPRIRDWFERVSEAELVLGVPHPKALLWGSPPRGGGHGNVRNRSLYGYRVGTVACYAAVGAGMHATRQAGTRQDPRRRMFEFPAITRSYYDGLILACMLRWAEPHECWWGSGPSEQAAVMSELLARTTDEADQKLLFPELLLAAAQGKVPAAAHRVLTSTIDAVCWAWPEVDRAPLELGRHLLVASQISPTRSTDAAQTIHDN